MKNRLTRTLAGLFAILSLTMASCDKDEDRVTLTPNSTPTLTASTNSVVLSQDNATQTAVTYNWTPVSGFTWNGAGTPYDPAVQYTIQIDRQNNNFATPVTIDAGTTAPTAVTVRALNASLNNLGIAPGTATPLQVRLAATYAANAPLYSPVVNLTATAYKECVAPNSDKWSIIGPAGVDWNTDVFMTYDCDLKAYTLTRTLNAGVFKFRKNSDWNLVNYGSTTTRNSSGTAPIDTNNDNNISVPTTGTYTVILNLNNKTYTLKQ